MKKLIPFLCLLSLSAWASVPEVNDILEIDAVIDGDTRNQVMNHNDPLTNAVGVLTYGNSWCTATLITPRHVLTNGHCVALAASPPFKIRPAYGFKFYPGKLNAADPGKGEYRSVRIDTFGQWVQTGNQDYDVAVIKLDRAVVGVKPAVIQRNNSIDNFKDFLLSINGYSSQKPFGTQWFGTGFCQGTTGVNSFWHNIDTLPGTSGSLVRKRYGNLWVGVGIHRGSQTDKNGTLNRAVLFNNTVFGAIQRWIKN